MPLPAPGRIWPTLLLALAAGVLGAAPAAQEEAAASVRAIDGDTLEIDGEIVQLYGIDAPELGQYCQRGDDLWACGVDAARFLQMTVQFEGPTLECLPWSEQAAQAGGDALVGVCRVGPKVIGLTMVRNGYAVALPDSYPDYAEAEEQARGAKLGLWQSDFVPPWEWRAGKGAAARSSDWVRTCNVKGARTAAGEAVYYVPTDAAYEGVVIEPARGERLFCSDEEARAAGWTRPRGAPSGG